jgi:hypothetical protein
VKKEENRDNNTINLDSDYMSRWVVLKRRVGAVTSQRVLKVLFYVNNWVRTIRSLVQGRIHKLKNCVNSRPKSVFKDQEAVKCLSSLHDKNYLEIMFPIDVLRFSEFRTMRNHLSETLMLNDIQITSDYMSRWYVLTRRVKNTKILS